MLLAADRANLLDECHYLAKKFHAGKKAYFIWWMK